MKNTLYCLKQKSDLHRRAIFTMEQNSPSWICFLFSKICIINVFAYYFKQYLFLLLWYLFKMYDTEFIGYLFALDGHLTQGMDGSA